MMRTKLELDLETAKESFIESYLLHLPDIVTYSVDRIDGRKESTIKSTELIRKLDNLVIRDATKFKNSFIRHLGAMEGYLAYSSSPKAFEKSWKYRKTKISKLSLFEVQELLSTQAQLIPMITSDNLFNSGEKGMIKSAENGAFLYGIRHSKGNYNDTLDELGNFSYQPPFDALGMLRYRWLEHLTLQCNFPLYMFVTMWFKYDALAETNHVTMICPVKITRKSSFFDSPLSLQLISVNESVERTMMIRSMDTLDVATKIRSGLLEEHVVKFNYESLKANAKLRANLVNWARAKGKKCPGEKCQNIEFRKIEKKSNIHLGHIVPQSWGGVFQFLQEKNHIHHPDNLYLSCHTCNTSLNASFPGDELRKNIVDISFGTVGDYIRSDPEYFFTADE